MVLGATGTVLGVSREYLAVPEQTNCAGSVHQHPGRSHGDSDSGRSQGCCGRYGHRGQAVPGTHLCLGKKGKRSELCQGYRECLAWAGQGMEAGHEWGSSRGHKGRDPATAWAQGCWVADVLTPPTPAQPQSVHSAPSTRAVSTTGYPEHVCTRQRRWLGTAGTHPGTGWQPHQGHGSLGGRGRCVPQGCWCRAGCSCASPEHTRRCLVGVKRAVCGFSMQGGKAAQRCCWGGGRAACPAPSELHILL